MKLHLSKQIPGLTLALLTALLPSILAAQPHHGHDEGRDITGIVAQTETMPTDDAVLDLAPSALQLAFPQRVRLVKLVLRNDQKDWIDIDFRYDPRAERNFNWNLPTLAAASYYTAEWAILDAQERLIRGRFSFAFGPDAEPPSVAQAAELRLLQQRYGDPDIRYVAPPPTQIILDQDQPPIDPPFTIRLDQQNQNPN